MGTPTTTGEAVGELTKVIPMANQPRKRSREESEKLWLHGVAHVLLTVMSLFSIFPVWWVVSMAFDADATAGVLRVFPAHFSFAAFQSVIAHPTEIDGLSFWQLLWNSTLLSAGTTVIGIVLGASAAYAFSRFRFPGRNAGLMSFLVLQMFPAVASIAPVASIPAALARQLAGDQLVVAHRTSQQLERLHLGPVLGLRREDRDHLGAVERALDLGPQRLAQGRAGREEVAPEDALGLLGAGGAPRPGAVAPVAGELDVDPARHRVANLLRRRGASSRTVPRTPERQALGPAGAGPT